MKTSGAYDTYVGPTLFTMFLMVGIAAVSFANWRPWGNDGILKPKELAWHLLSVGLFLLAITGYKLGDVKLGMIGLVPLLGIISCMQNGMNAVTMRLTVNLMLGVMFVWSVTSMVGRIKLNDILKTICIVACFQAAYSLLQIYTDPIFASTDIFHRIGYQPILRDRMFGFIGTPAHLSCYLAVCLPTCLAFRWPYNLFPMILMTVPIILIFNSVGLLAALLFYGFFLYRRLGKYIAFNLRSLAMLILLGFLAALVFKDPGGRYAIWMQTVKMALDHPIIGYGLGTFSNSVLMVEHTAAGNILWVHPHNEFLYVFFSAGFLGVFIFLLWLLELFMTLN